MDAYRNAAREKFLKQKELEMQKILEQERIEQQRIEEETKKLEKIKYVSSQINYLNEAIESLKGRYTDDNIFMASTIIYASIENIIRDINDETKQSIIAKIIELTNDINSNIPKRNKNINTLTNVKMIADGFKRIYDILDLHIDIETTYTEDDEKIAREILERDKLLNDEKIARELLKRDKTYKDDEKLAKALYEQEKRKKQLNYKRKQIYA